MSIFHFQQFSVNQSGATMKINTDGVLLAAHCHSSSLVQYILDIGTGTGVIALMLAQKFPQAHITAIDIDAQTLQLAQHNFQNSSFYPRLKASHSAIQDFESQVLFHLIISNPPFYIDSLPNPDTRKMNARHTDVLFFEQMFQKTAQILHPQGVFWLIIPISIADKIAEIATQKGFYIHQQITIFNQQEGNAIRYIWVLGKVKIPEIEYTDFYIRDADNQYTATYRTLLKDYFL